MSARLSVTLAVSVSLIVLSTFAGKAVATRMMAQDGLPDSELDCTAIGFTHFTADSNELPRPVQNGFDSHLRRPVDVAGSAGVVDIFTFYSRPRDRDLTHYSNEDRPAGNWRTGPETLSWLESPTGPLSLRILTKSKSNVVFLSWYNVGGTVTTNRRVAKLLTIPQYFVGRRDASYVSVLLNCGSDCRSEVDALPEFLSDNAWLQDVVGHCN
jgi:hypothetical protein